MMAWLRSSYRRHRFPPEIIQHATWLYLRFTLSYRDVEELLAERGPLHRHPEDEVATLMIQIDRTVITASRTE
jgi:hypothetical protein